MPRRRRRRMEIAIVSCVIYGSQFESGGASGSGGCGDDKENADEEEEEDGDSDNGAVFANGCLHWLVSHIDIKTKDGGRPIIWFDVKKDEFGLFDLPKRMCDLWRNYSCLRDHLVDLNGDVGYVCCKTRDVWVLKQKQWVPHCHFKCYPNGGIEVLGC
ncbi:F-box domain containing protein [Tanacetum coccineum]